MTALAEEDVAAVWSLTNEFNPELTAVVVGRLREIGRGDVADDVDAVSGIVMDIGFMLLGSAHAWSADGGALPWVWARRAVERLISDAVGHRVVSIDDRGHDDDSGTPMLTELPDETGVESSADVDLDALADSEPTAELLLDAIARVASPRDQQVHIEYRMQHAGGDPSPSHTIGELFGLGAANVRQIDRRVRTKLRTLVANDPVYAGLEGLPWLS